MATTTRTWWGERFLAAIEAFTDPGRLSRGRAYATNGKILDWTIKPGVVEATVRGSVNPYFGVYKEPRYKVVVTLGAIDAGRWEAIANRIGARASLVTPLLMGEMPDGIEAPFEEAGVHLLPHRTTLPKTSCSCPDWANPCKHVAGLYYLLARSLDRDPFLMFELRGLTREALREALARTPLGAALASDLAAAPVPFVPDGSLFGATPMGPAPTAVDPREFWQGPGSLGAALSEIAPLAVPALTIKREGDFPAFWPREGSFIDVMEELYGRVRKSLGS